jgi:hypothetical protein
MNYTADALASLRATLAEVLDGRATLDDLRRRGRRATNGLVRVTRRAGDADVPRRRGGWPMTIADACAAETFGSYETYVPMPSASSAGRAPCTSRSTPTGCDHLAVESPSGSNAIEAHPT